MAHARKHIHFADHVMRWLAQGNDKLSGRVNSVVDRYQETLRRSEPIEAVFTAAERRLIIDACRDVTFRPAANIFASMALIIAEHGANQSLMDKINSLSPWEQVLLAEWIEAQG